MPSVEVSDAGKFENWLREVDHRMMDKFGIDTSDAGLDESQLQLYWKWNDTPSEFVQWFGKKYDLTPISDYRWHSTESTA